MMMALASQTPTAAQWPREHYEQAIQLPQPRRVVLVVEEQTTLLAFLVAKAVALEWELENIAVTVEMRRRGLGSSILGQFLDMARQEKAEALFLEVRESNRAARAFYENRALAETGRRPRYYVHPEEDAVVYRLLVS